MTDIEECVVCGSQLPSSGSCVRCESVRSWVLLVRDKNPTELISFLKKTIVELEIRGQYKK